MQIDSLIKHMISINNYNFKFAIPAIVVGVSNIKDGLIDVLPIVNSVNQLQPFERRFPLLRLCSP